MIIRNHLLSIVLHPGFAIHLDLGALLHSALGQDAAPRSTHGHFGMSSPAKFHPNKHRISKDDIKLGHSHQFRGTHCHIDTFKSIS